MTYRTGEGWKWEGRADYELGLAAGRTGALANAFEGHGNLAAYHQGYRDGLSQYQAQREERLALHPHKTWRD